MGEWALICSLVFFLIDKLFVIVVADEAIWNKKNTQLENKVTVFIMVDSVDKTKVKKGIARLFMSFNAREKFDSSIIKLKSNAPLLEKYSPLPDNVFSYLIDVKQLYRLFRNKTHNMKLYEMLKRESDAAQKADNLANEFA